MNRQRALEIAQSADMKHVTYNGHPIYIQHVNDQHTARIFALDDPENEFDAQLAKLNENQ
ncbi:small acid-soluble spore protein H (minor) [Lentibacillus halodurans]|uniref:Small, acid-soluble spore protein H n=1 Tax=Lentibacillus halodurans TaxID=237679 RepID=A0A1I0X0E3_9BACI|nr:H-type small acid-soluble spore protein [Lentibacillus halodurans]SFA94294.1 small acid-soluble spore protein H (minor) [Lentibacillus halodurans]